MLYNIHVHIGREFIVQCLLVFGFVRYHIIIVVMIFIAIYHPR